MHCTFFVGVCVGRNERNEEKNKISSQSSVLLPRSVVATAYMLLHSYRSRSCVREKEKILISTSRDRSVEKKSRDMRSIHASIHLLISGVSTEPPRM